ncbi:MAG: hypothetical protein M0P13_11030 [Fibrobacteraceae bacterium]|nr:hypothetical protein [Fibrobacteraceae bacterium]
MQSKVKRWIFLGAAFILIFAYLIVKAFFIEPNEVSYRIVFDKNIHAKKIISERCRKMKVHRCIDVTEKGDGLYVGINDSKALKNESKSQIEYDFKNGMKSKIWNGSKLTVSNVIGFDTIANNDFQNLSAKIEIRPRFDHEIEFSDYIDSVKIKKLDDAFEVRVYLDSAGKQKFSELTKGSIEKMLAIKIDSTVLVMPIVKTEITDGQIPIYLDKTFAEVVDIAEALEQRVLDKKLVFNRIEI